MNPAGSIVVVLPNSMAVRTFMQTPVMEELSRWKGRTTYVLTPRSADKKVIRRRDVPNVIWRSIYVPSEKPSDRKVRMARLCRSACLRIIRILRAEYKNLVFRFNHISGFQGHRQKVNMPSERRKREALAGNHSDLRLGRPFVDSRSLYKLLHRLHFGGWQCLNQPVAAFYREVDPDLVVLWNIQNFLANDYLVAANRMAVPTAAVISSWDMPTTKGPIGPGVRRFIVNSRNMKRELERYHGIDPGKVDVVGWPQMDVYAKQVMQRERLMDELGVDSSRKLIVFAANSARLGRHEPSVVDYLAKRVNDAYAYPCTLIVRPHPKDKEWKARFESAIGTPGVVVLPAEMDRLDYLGALMNAADVVVSSQGSITMDAIAFDTCVVNIGFDGAVRVDDSESSRHWYQMDHYRPVLESGAVWLVGSFEELDAAIDGYLSDPDLHASGRSLLRAQQLAPMDGQASARIVNIIKGLAAPQRTPPVAESVDSVVGV